jgi:ceramide glucosyltransferase
VNQPGFASLIITFATPWIVAGAWLALDFRSGELASAHPWGATALAVNSAIGVAARIVLHARGARDSHSFWRDLPLVPLRDTLLALQWLAGAFGSHVVWRGARVPVAPSSNPINPSV